MSSSEQAIRQQIRGSSLLVAGRGLGAASNFVGQIILVRYLAQTDYGALAYALSVVAFCQALSMLGMRTTIMRFVPMYHETGEYGKLHGVLTVAVLATVTAGIALIAFLSWWPAMLSRWVSGDGTPIRLLAVMAYMIPLQALDILLINLFASFGKTRAIFLRKFVVAPTLKLSVVLVLVASGGGVLVMAYGYLVGAVIALLFSLWTVRGVLREAGVLDDRRGLGPSLGGVSVSELARFSGSILINEMVPAFIHSVNVFLLGLYCGAAEVAIYTVVVPAARLNRLMMDNVRVLYLPLASRLSSRGDREGLNNLYWQTATWTMLASFPLFALTFVAAGPVTELLYGATYRSSSTVLMVLAFAYYFEVALGCNIETLRMAGRVRYLLGVDAVTAALNVVGNVILIRHYGAIGAGLCTAGTIVLQGLLRQFGLRAVEGVAPIDIRCLQFYPLIAAFTMILLGVRQFGEQSFPILALAVCAFSVLLLLLTRKHLQIGTMFPELTRVPLLRLLVS